jgi:chromosome segregation ATPase
LDDINELASELRFLQIRCDKILSESNDHQNFEFNLFQNITDIVAPAVQPDPTSQKAALQREHDELEDLWDHLTKLFAPESADQMKAEVEIEKTSIQRIKAEIATLVEQTNRIERQRNSEELSQANAKFLDHKSGLEGLTCEFSALLIEHQQIREQLVSSGKTEEKGEESELSHELADLRAQKFVKRQQLQKLERTLAAKRQSVINKRPYVLLAQKTVYALGRFPVHQHLSSYYL